MRKIIFHMILTICSGACICHADSLAGQLFYHLKYHKFQVVNPQGNPVPHAKATFLYQSNFDVSGKNTRLHCEPIHFDENGRATRFGWVRHTARLRDIFAPGYYSRRCFDPEKDGEKIVLLPIVSPVPVFRRDIRLDIEPEWVGKLEFRFSDLELGIRLNPEYRIARTWDAAKKTAVWKRMKNEKDTPDLIFEFLPPQGEKTHSGQPYEARQVTATFAEGMISDFQNHDSVFAGPYQIPYGDPLGFGEPRWPSCKVPFRDGYCKQAMMFSFMHRKKRCFGIIRHLNVGHPMNRRKTIHFELELNLSGSRNMERDFARSVSHPREHLWRDRVTLSPEKIRAEQNFDQRKSPKPVALIQELHTRKVSVFLYGEKKTDRREVHMVLLRTERDGDQWISSAHLKQEGQLPGGTCAHELRDVNFDGNPDLLLHSDCGNGNHVHQIFLYDPETLRFRYARDFSQTLSGHLTLVPEKRIIRTRWHINAGEAIEKYYDVTSQGTLKERKAERKIDRSRF